MNINNFIGGVNKPPKPIKSFDSGAPAKNVNSDSFKAKLASNTQPPDRAQQARTDRIQFSHSVGTSNTLELANLKNKITTDLKAETKTEKLDRITKQIENKEYRVDPYELAQIMFRG